MADLVRDLRALSCRPVYRADSAVINAAADELARLYSLTMPLNPDLGDVSDLPEELRSEILGPGKHSLEVQIATVINAYGGTASLDQVLVGLYRKFGIVQKRRYVQNRLSRMVGVRNAQGGRGLYTTAAED